MIDSYLWLFHPTVIAPTWFYFCQVGCSCYLWPYKGKNKHLLVQTAAMDTLKQGFTSLNFFFVSFISCYVMSIKHTVCTYCTYIDLYNYHYSRGNAFVDKGVNAAACSCMQLKEMANINYFRLVFTLRWCHIFQSNFWIWHTFG